MPEDLDPGDSGVWVGDGLHCDMTGAFGGEWGVSTVAAGGSLHLLVGHKRRGEAEGVIRCPRIRRLYHEDLLCLFGKPPKRPRYAAGCPISAFTCEQSLDDPSNTRAAGKDRQEEPLVEGRRDLPVGKQQGVWERARQPPVGTGQQGLQSGGQQELPSGGQQPKQSGEQQWIQAGGQQELQTGGQQELQAGGKQELQARGQQELQAGGQQEPQAGGQQELQAGGQQEPQVGGQQALVAEVEVESHAGGQQELQAGGQQALMTEMEVESHAGGQQELKRRGQQQLQNGGQQGLCIKGQQELQSGGEQPRKGQPELPREGQLPAREQQAADVEMAELPRDVEMPREEWQELPTGGQQELPAGRQQELPAGERREPPGGGGGRGGGQRELPAREQQEVANPDAVSQASRTRARGRGGSRRSCKSQGRIGSGAAAQQAEGQLGATEAPQGAHQAGGQSRAPGAPHGEQQAKGQLRVPGAPQGEQQAGGQPRVPGAPQGERQAGGQLRVPGAPQGEQQAGGQPGVTETPQGGQQALAAEMEVEQGVGEQQELQAGGQQELQELEVEMEEPQEQSRWEPPVCMQEGSQTGNQPQSQGGRQGPGGTGQAERSRARRRRGRRQGGQQDGGQPGVTRAPQGEQQSGGQPGVAGAPQRVQQPGGQPGAIGAPQGVQQAGGQPGVPGAPQGAQQAGGQPRVLGAPQGVQQAGGQPRVPGAPQGVQQTGGQPGVPGAPQEGVQQAGGQPGVPGAPQGVQQAGGQPRAPGAPQGVQQAGGQPRVPGAPQGVQQAGGQPRVPGAPQGVQQAGGQLRVPGAPQGVQQAGGQLRVPGAPQEVQQAGSAASRRAAEGARGTPGSAASRRAAEGTRGTPGNAAGSRAAEGARSTPGRVAGRGAAGGDRSTPRRAAASGAAGGDPTPQGEQQAGEQPGVTGAPQGEQQAEEQPGVIGAPQEVEQAGGQKMVPGEPQGVQQAGGQPRVPRAPQGVQQAGGQPRVPGAPQGEQQAGGQLGVTGAPQGAQQPGGQPRVPRAPQGAQQAGGGSMDDQEQQLEEWCRLLEFGTPMATAEESEADGEPPRPPSPSPRFPCDTCFHTSAMRGAVANHMRVCRAAETERRAHALGSIPSLVETDTQERPTPREFGDEAWAGVTSWEWETFFNVEAVGGRTVRRIPQRARSGVLDVLCCILKRLKSQPGDEAATLLLLAFPCLILAVPPKPCIGQKALITERLGAFWEGRRRELFDSAMVAARPAVRPLSYTCSDQDPDAIRLSRCRSRCKVGEWSRGLACLTARELARPPEAMVQSLREKHPASTSEVPQWVRNFTVDTAQRPSLTTDILARAIHTAARASAAGPLGWVTKHLRDTFLTEPSCLSHLLEVFNQWVAGQVPERARPWLAASNLVGLSKLIGDVRPVAIGEVLPRILARALCISLRPAMVSYFLPCNQLGAGTRVGAEILTHSFHSALATHPDWCALQIDVANAFNSFHRHAMFDGLRESPFSGMIPFLRVIYGTPSDLYLQACPFVQSLESARGSRQRDPLGPFLFAFTQQQVMEPERLEWVGLEVQAQKCRFWECEGREVERAVPLGMQRVDEGLTVVGVPIGEEVWEVVRLRERLRQLQAPLPWLPLLDHPQMASHLLAIAVSVRPMYLARTMPPRPEVVEAFRD
ncbi:unnamed protein product [Closterium sp. NIES-64]|nr:unnamed protein product [Closterium sp. NIES-64]